MHTSLVAACSQQQWPPAQVSEVAVSIWGMEEIKCLQGLVGTPEVSSALPGTVRWGGSHAKMEDRDEGVGCCMKLAGTLSQ